MNLVQVEGRKNLMRDLDTGAILNLDDKRSAGFKLAKLNRQNQKDQLEKNTNDINSIKDELTEIKTMLRTLINGR